MIDCLTELIPKHKSLNNNNKVLRNPNTKGGGEVGRENTSDYIRSNKRIHYIDD
ncbi:MAG: hypothetical protein ICV56_07345 [Nitrososphaeraceae archaeon]|nr:hypothetical protein [Nitrososphaeraceae archaeon]